MQRVGDPSHFKALGPEATKRLGRAQGQRRSVENGFGKVGSRLGVLAALCFMIFHVLYSWNLLEQSWEKTPRECHFQCTTVQTKMLQDRGPTQRRPKAVAAARGLELGRGLGSIACGGVGAVAI